MIGRSNIRRVIIISLILSLFCLVASAQDPAVEPRPQVALVLEGGAALGLAHIGVIKIIEELGIPVDIVVGTSMGATVGGFYAEGFNAAALEEIALDIDWFDVFFEGVTSSEENFRSRVDGSRYFASLGFDARGLKTPGRVLSGRKMIYLLDRLTISQPSPLDFDTLPRRYRAVTVDLATGERVVIGNGSLADAMRASMGIPGLFAPYLIGDRYLVDGGAVDNLPVDVARGLGADLIIAVDLIGGTPFSPEEFDRNPLDALNRTVMIMLRENVKVQLPGADLVVSVDLTGYQPTDFGKTAEIIALGEKSARALRSELEAFKARLGSLLTEETDIGLKDQPSIQKVIVEGGNEKDRARVRALCTQIYGLSSTETVEKLYDTIEILEELGIYESIRVRRSEDESIPTLVLTLKRRQEPGQSVRLGLEYESSYSGSNVGWFSLLPSIVFRDLTTDDSRLAINMRILDSPALNVSFVQPISERLFVEGVLQARQNTEAFSNESTVDFLYQNRAVNIGINVGINPAKWAEASLGLSYEWMQYDQIPFIRSGERMASAPMAHARFLINKLDSPVFPSRGLSAQISYDQSLSWTGNSRYFGTITSSGVYIPSCAVPVSFSGFWKVGSDFSALSDDSGAAPLNYKPDLADRNFFMGPLEAEERIGSHIAGLGGEIKFQINWASVAIGFPSFLLVQSAAGFVLQDMADINRLSELSHLSAMLGVGTRINDGFGVSLRVGILRGFSRSFRPFVTFNLGSIGY